MEAAEITVSQEQEREHEKEPLEEFPDLPPPEEKGTGPLRVEPDLDFIRALSKSGGESLKKCMQCGTCSAACPLSPSDHPFPRKEMAWAVWGMKDALVTDPDVWLCHHCNDCSTNCPRDSRPGDVLGAVRQQCILQYAFPRFLARWVNDPRYIPLLLAIPALLLWGALEVRDPLGQALGFSVPAGDSIVFSFVPMFPHWLLNAFFGIFVFLALVAAVVGVTRFVRAMKATSAWGENPEPVMGWGEALRTTFRKILTHENFTYCETDHRRSISHFMVLFGFLALVLVTLWVITGPYNPLIRGAFVYPFSAWSPWKILANLGGLAILLGLLMMLWDRLYFGHLAGTSSYFDWALVWALLLVTATGFATELLHYLRMNPHRHVAYYIHLVFVFALLVYLPYSKFAHVLYRTTAMVIAERFGRTVGDPARKGAES
jgi:quinone-modifying oxidoreductase subunit QmoC